MYDERFVIRDDGLVFSIDNVRIRGTFYTSIVRGREKIISELRSLDYEFDYNEFTSGRIGKFRDRFTMKCDNGNTYTLLMVQRTSTGREDWESWLLDYNPNKCSKDKMFVKLHDMLLSMSVDYKVDKHDMAVDVGVERGLVVLTKDQRIYERHEHGGDNYTEYLGRRNQIGRVKVYNKQKEMKLDSALTRIEITLGWPCDYETALVSWPRVGIIQKQLTMDEVLALDGYTQTDKFILQACLLHPDVEGYLSLLEPRKKRKLRKVLDGTRAILQLDNKVYCKYVNRLEMQLKPFILL